jgi:hypothetical protein
MPAKPVATEPVVAPTLTTAEAIRQQLADDQDQAPEVTLRTFAPDHLVPGRTLPRRFRSAGPSLGRYRSMVGELFSS